MGACSGPNFGCMSLMNKNDLLDEIYRSVESVILDKQHPATGLLPASTAVNNHGNYTDAWVRDNVYSVFAVWALGMAYRRQGESERSDQLEQCTIKLMRGLLLSMMRQSNKVEAFKTSFAPGDALHAKYNTATGLPVVADNAWGHLQIDATSLYLLMLAQMSASGLRIVRTFGEVDYIQNLVYYISSAYRTPDYGIWERGNKINNGKTEINASSVGMAKAALQALDGFNLFGKHASPRAVVHTVTDAVSLARNTLTGLLPRESLSKEVDAALLSIIGYPAFAIGDPALVERTRNEILSKLAGNYGCKRFLWDGHQTSIEDENRLYYEHSELVNFENIESEWPLFYTYLYLHALFDGNRSLAREYRLKLEELMVECEGKKLLPELYYVPKELVAAEKAKPHSQPRLPNENIPLVWAQSLYYTGLLLDEGMITANELDPLMMRRRSRQHIKTQVALVVLAENDNVKAKLIEHGVMAESLDEIAPVNVISAPQLVQMYSRIGANATLGLSGRPKRRLNLATSQAYEINGEPCLCLSWLQSEDNEYRNFDPCFMAENIKREVAYIKSQWYSNQAAVFTWLVDQRFCDTEHSDELFKMLRELQLRTEFQYVGYASATLAWRAARINSLLIPNVSITPFLPVTSIDLYYMDEGALNISARKILDAFRNGYIENCADQLISLAQNISPETLISTRESGKQITFQYLLDYIYHKAQRMNHWLLARVCFNLLKHNHNDLADALTLLSARNMTLVVESESNNHLVVNSSLTNEDFSAKVRACISSTLEYAMVLEALTVIGAITRIESSLFDGLRSINVHQLLTSCVGCKRQELKRELYSMAALPPSEVFNKIRSVFVSQKELYSRGIGASLDHLELNGKSGLSGDRDWLAWRSERGFATHLDNDFLQSVWNSFAQASILEFGDSFNREYTVHCEEVISSMTAGEVIFAQLIDGITLHLHPVYYKSLVIEALYAFAKFCELNPTAKFANTINFAKVLESAAENFVREKKLENTGERDLDVFLRQSPTSVNRYLTAIFSRLISTDQAA